MKYFDHRQAHYDASSDVFYIATGTAETGTCTKITIWATVDSTHDERTCIKDVSTGRKPLDTNNGGCKRWILKTALSICVVFVAILVLRITTE